MKKLKRDLNNEMFLGVCGGLGNYFEIDPTVWRLLFIVSFFLFPPTILAYFMFALAMPKS